MRLWYLSIEHDGIPIIHERLVNESELRDLCYTHGEPLIFEAVFYLNPHTNDFACNWGSTEISYHR